MEHNLIVEINVFIPFLFLKFSILFQFALFVQVYNYESHQLYLEVFSRDYREKIIRIIDF